MVCVCVCRCFVFEIWWCCMHPSVRCPLQIYANRKCRILQQRDPLAEFIYSQPETRIYSSWREMITELDERYVSHDWNEQKSAIWEKCTVAILNWIQRDLYREVRLHKVDRSLPSWTRLHHCNVWMCIQWGPAAKTTRQLCIEKYKHTNRSIQIKKQKQEQLQINW